ncbi:hypothetical protein TVAG_428550 [Trichomonas vaginalis G3]|uniref:Uncharacterized protein n=1 Tax=Trichomonas vaginalis (strain ATCC PRA-98 / G3) TaxID=412133 RepID=A2FJ45_TRIV3|nr:hypothetical protein TVAG_428550 [Trichomonas vaginalis G3]|eukprot:XP_001307982.1 hypothetical protein [Trichomonas vaginalis G3]
MLLVFAALTSSKIHRRNLLPRVYCHAPFYYKPKNSWGGRIPIDPIRGPGGWGWTHQEAEAQNAWGDERYEKLIPELVSL